MTRKVWVSINPVLERMEADDEAEYDRISGGFDRGSYTDVRAGGESEYGEVPIQHAPSLPGAISGSGGSRQRSRMGKAWAVPKELSDPESHSLGECGSCGHHWCLSRFNEEPTCWCGCGGPRR